MAEILVVEDEPIIAQDISMSIQHMGHHVLGVKTSAEEAISYLLSNKPDLIILDVNLEGEMDGIDFGKKLHAQYHIPFIYLTSYYDRVTVNRAKETFPASYIIKPFDEEDLKLNIELALYKGKVKARLKTDKLFVKKGQNLVALDAATIAYAEADDNYTRIHVNAETYVVSHTLKTIEEKLQGRGFLRIHKSFLINFEMISSISEGMVYVLDQHIPIGKAYKQQFQELLQTL